MYLWNPFAFACASLGVLEFATSSWCMCMCMCMWMIELSLVVIP